MRPAHKLISAGVWKSESRLVSHFEAALFESIRTWSFDRYRFAEVHPIRSFFFIPKKGKGISLCQRNFMLETSLSKLPVRNCSNCLVKPVRFNLPASWKTATPDAREALPSWKCPARKKRLRRLINSMARKSAVAPLKSMKPNHVKIAAAADVALATIAAVAMAAMVDAGPSRAGNNQHATQCFGLRDDPIIPEGRARCSSPITTCTRR